ncbi:hypothetical protein AURDEDRAFT_123532 [Auricularia subglabra TFB-10046 SS5]|nr:hypothetical protein AURDEDRAFT_123532 [Auricularia subglabra TFB-10046 SS5]
MSSPDDLAKFTPGPYADGDTIVMGLALLLEAIKADTRDPESNTVIRNVFGYLADGKDEPLSYDKGADRDLTQLLEAVAADARDPESEAMLCDILGYLADGKDEPLSNDDGATGDVNMASGLQLDPEQSSSRNDEKSATYAQGPRIAAANPAEGSAVGTGKRLKWTVDNEGDVGDVDIASHVHLDPQEQGDSRIDEKPAVRAQGPRIAAAGLAKGTAAGTGNPLKRKHMSDEKWAKERDKKWRAQNRKSLKKACENIPLVAGEDQHPSSEPYPEFPKSITLSANEPLMVVDKNGIPMVVDILYECLMRFGYEISVNIKKAADKNTRDSLASLYARRKHTNELHGVFQLVTLWRAIGRNAKTAEAGPTWDVVDSIRKFNNSLKLLKLPRLVLSHLDHCLWQHDQEQHAWQLTMASAKLKEKEVGVHAIKLIHHHEILKNMTKTL